MRVSLLLSAPLLIGCAAAPGEHAAQADPPVQAFVALPLADDDPAVLFADEHDVFNLVRRTYVMHGWKEAGSVPLLLSADAVIPFAGDGEIFSPPFLGPAASMKTHLDAVSAGFYGGRLDDYSTKFPTQADADAAYHAFMVTMLLHEMAHAVAQKRGVGTTQSDAYFEEMRAIDFEVALLDELVCSAQLPALWLERYAEFNRVLLAAAPEGLVATLPTTPEARALAFNEHYAEMNAAREQTIATGRNEAQSSTDLVLAMYTQRRLERAAAPKPLSALRDALDPPALDTYLEQTLTSSGIAYKREGKTFTFTGGTAQYEARISAGNVYFRGTLGLHVPVERRGAVLDLANRVHAEERWGRFELTEEGRIQLTYVAEDPTNFKAVSKIRRATEMAARYHLAFEAVIAGKDPAAALHRPEDGASQ